jgi:hypothetical protein
MLTANTEVGVISRAPNFKVRCLVIRIAFPLDGLVIAHSRIPSKAVASPDPLVNEPVFAVTQRAKGYGNIGVSADCPVCPTWRNYDNLARAC